MIDYYDIFEISPEASSEQIKKRYKLLLHAWHPDKFPDQSLKKEAEEKIKLINEAYSIIGNPQKRYVYDKLRFAFYKERNREYQKPRDSESVKERGEQAETHETKVGSSKKEAQYIKQLKYFVISIFFILLALFLFVKIQPSSKEIINPTFTYIPTIKIIETPTLDIINSTITMIIPTNYFAFQTQQCDRNKVALIYENYPDGTIVKRDEFIIKTWYLKNIGDCIWKPFQLRYAGGAPLTTETPINFKESIAPGDVVPVSVPFIVPKSSGLIVQYWRLLDMGNPPQYFLGLNVITIKVRVLYE